ncbi:MAG: lytic transglycosylase domain-containing protein [Candidatus Marinimicrobia bacterium]|nr:lytic transglycosylase domain-containing protein [Candidatus Neomarinimicrobiota bacterium]
MRLTILAVITIVGISQADNDRLIQALIQVESSGNDQAIGDGGLAVGCLQIHPIFVKDVNRIIGKDKYTLQDRYSRAKSIEMANIYLNHYGGTIEERARKFNGGPNGHQKKATENYWRKVKRELDR